jgi:hypothetical protein
MSQLCLFDIALVSEAGSQAPDVDLRAVLSKATTTTLLGPTGLSQQFQVTVGHNFTSKSPRLLYLYHVQEVSKRG